MPLYVCPRCQRLFDRKSNYDQHLRRLKPCHIKTASPSSKELYICEQCKHSFSNASNLNRHLKANKHNIPTVDNVSNIGTVLKEVQVLKDAFEQLKNQPTTQINNQNILQVLCVKSSENYLDLLTDQCGDFHQALEFVKDCALSNLSGDCKLLTKIYFDTNHQDKPIKYIDRNQRILEYIDENQHKVVDRDGQRLGKILANNLQNSYLKGINYLINQGLNDHVCPGKFLEDYDIQNWNTHIYQLSDVKYQKKMFTQLEIPV